MTDQIIREERKRQVLIKRLIVVIVLLIKENPVLPFSFVFMGGCLLENLKQERTMYKIAREKYYDTIGKSKMDSLDGQTTNFMNERGYNEFMAPAVTPPNIHEPRAKQGT